MNLKGVVPVLCTPFAQDESIDEPGLRREVNFALQCGAVALCAPAYGSEFYKLSDSERCRVAQVVIEEAGGRIPVIVSATSGSIRTTVEYAAYAETLGASGIMVAAPRSVPLGVSETLSYYEAVCQSVKVPVVLQDADFTGSGLPAQLFRDLAGRCPNFLFAKLENPLAGAKCKQIVDLSGGRIDVLFGWGGLTLFEGLDHGAAGVMPGTALTDIHVRTIGLYRSGKTVEAQALLGRCVPLLAFSLQHLEWFIAMEKRILVKRGVLKSTRLREPTLHLDAEYERRMDSLIDELMPVLLIKMPS
jgi:dihydrodipicolinate synthase/N-acetylneuraminate lyase